MVGRACVWSDDPGAVPCEAGHIVQGYLANPYLVKGNKAHLRLYLLITSVAPLRAYLWGDGIVRIAPEPFRESPGWLERHAMHITNTALHKGHPDLRLSQDGKVENEGHIWTVRALLRHIEEEGGDVTELLKRLRLLALGLIKVIAHSGLFARQDANPAKRSHSPKFIGIDVVLDSELRPWLMECARMPGQTGTPVVEAVNARLFRTITEMIVHQLGDDPAAWPARELAAERQARGVFMPLEPL